MEYVDANPGETIIMFSKRICEIAKISELPCRGRHNEVIVTAFPESYFHDIAGIFDLMNSLNRNK